MGRIGRMHEFDEYFYIKTDSWSVRTSWLALFKISGQAWIEVCLILHHLGMQGSQSITQVVLDRGWGKNESSERCVGHDSSLPVDARGNVY